MYNRPSSKTRYQQEPTMESVNLKERQLYLQSSSINPLTGAAIRSDQQYAQSQQYNNANFDKKVALQASSINPLTGAPIGRNPINYQQNQPQQQQQQRYTPYGVQQQQDVYQTSAGQIGASPNTNDVQFQKNLIKFFGADDPTQVQKKRQPNEVQPSDPSFQRNLVKFFGADDPNQPKRPKDTNRQVPSRQNYQQQSYEPQPQYNKGSNDQQFQQNLSKFFAADDPNPVKKPRSKPQPKEDYQQPYQQGYSNQQSRNNSQPFNEAPPDPRLVNDPAFQRNLGKFFAADDPSQPKKHSSKQNLQQQQINQIEENKLQRLQQDQRFQKNLQQFFGIDGPQKNGQNVQGIAPQQTNKVNKIIAITDSSSAARNQVAAFFRTRGVDDFDVFTAPGGVFGLQNSQVWEQSLKQYLDTMNNAYNIKEVYLISALDSNSNAKLYTNVNDKRSHQIAITDLKTILENRLGVSYKLNGIIIDQRGASEKVF